MELGLHQRGVSGNPVHFDDLSGQDVGEVLEDDHGGGVRTRGFNFGGEINGAAGGHAEGVGLHGESIAGYASHWMRIH